jgi:Ni/Co efflux regulator RcnB
MRMLVISAMALALAMTPGAANAGKGPRAGHAAMSHVGAPHVGNQGRWMNKRDGRWMGGWNAPGGWNGYRPVSRGYILPRYWVSPSFYIGNYSRYGFAQPQNGYGWSRYYDDAVLTDRDGRVYDSVRGFDWDRYGDDNESYAEDYSDSYGYRDDGYRQAQSRQRDRDGGLGGAVVGGVVGAVAGNIIGGKGDRLAGSLIGGGVGALAGAAIDSGDRAGRGYSDRGYDDRRYRKVKKAKRIRNRDYDDRYQDDYMDRRYSSRDVNYDGRWQGTWRGSYDGGPVRDYRGTYEGRYNGRAPHWGHHGGGHVVHHNGGSYGYGYGGGEVTVISVQSAPVVTTTTTTSEEVIYAAATRKRVYHARPKRVWKPRPKCHC